MEDLLPMKELQFNSLIKPLLKFPPNKNNLFYFYEQAYRLWILWIEKKDIQEIIKIEQICINFLNKDRSFIISLINEIYENLHDYRANLESTWGIYYTNIGSDIDNNHKFKYWFDYYKSFFEKEFNLWSSILVAYLIKYFNLPKETKNKYKSVASFITLWSSDKYSIISSSKILNLWDSIDRIYRNAWAWHDNWDIQDDWKCLLKNINPKTWEIISSTLITLEDLKNKIKLIEKYCLLLDLWINIFINNFNLHDDIKIKKWKKIKIKEIERVINAYAREYHLKINLFNFSNDRSNLEFEIEKIQKFPSMKIWTVYTDKSAHDLIEIKKNVKYINQIFWLIYHVLYLNNYNSFDLSLKIKDSDNNSIFIWNFISKEISKLLLLDKKNLPLPTIWNLPEDEYTLILEKIVPYWLWQDSQHILNDNPLFTKDYKDYILLKLDL